MLDSGHDSSPAERFARRYARPQSEAELNVELEVFGAYIGTDGYTTVPEADALMERLELRRGARLLELGSGRGWPGVYVTSRSGCQVVLTDVPVAAPAESLSNARRGGIGDRSAAAAADGSALPFHPNVFDAVVHSDVFC
ncbi:MAG: methyltransferase domain-containing protein [Gemmatimonadota bacterium]